MNNSKLFSVLPVNNYSDKFYGRKDYLKEMDELIRAARGFRLAFGQHAERIGGQGFPFFQLSARPPDCNRVGLFRRAKTEMQG